MHTGPDVSHEEVDHGRLTWERHLRWAGSCADEYVSATRFCTVGSHSGFYATYVPVAWLLIAFILALVLGICIGFP